MKAIKAYVIFLIFLTILAITPVLAQPYNLASVNWVKYISLSERNDEAYGTCIFGEYLAVVGEVGICPSLVLLDRSTGYIVREWIGEDYGCFYNCFPVGNVLYVVGNIWTRGREGSVVYAFNKDLNLSNKARGPSNSRFSSITYDGEYLYIGGEIWEDINLDGHEEPICYIEKRTKSLELISYKELYTENWKGGDIVDLGINPVTGELWAVGGYEDTSNKTHSLIVIFDKELRELKRIDYSEDNEYYLDWLLSICFDNIGNAYAGSLWGVAKFDKNGNILKVNKDVGAEKIAFINGLVYAFDDVYIDNYYRHVLYILDSELNMIEKCVLSEKINADSYFFLLFCAGRPCFDGKSIYVAGFDRALGRERWVVYSFTAPTKYLVCIDNSYNFYEKGSIISPKQDIPTLGGLIIKRFEGYLDSYGNNIGKSVVVDGPLTLSSAYREELNLPLLSVIIVIVLVPSFLVWMNRSKIKPIAEQWINKIKIEKKSGTIVKEAKGEEKTGTEVRELTKDELEKELAILNERLSRLEELYKKGEVDEEAYKKLKEEYESRKIELEKRKKEESAKLE